MPRYCKVKAREFSENDVASKAYENGCETIIPYLGIDPGSDDDDGSWIGFIWETVKVALDPNSCWFQVFVLFLATGIAFMLGVYIRRRTIIGLLRQKEEWIDKEKMLLNQLWAALEEKLENKSMLHESRNSLEKIKVELDSEKAEKESLQSRMWGLQRNVKILQSERDVLEEKLRDCISTFSGLRQSLAKNAGKGESGEVSNCMEKIKGLQALMQKLIEAHRQEHINFVAMLEKQPSV
uniref:Uncharacterized LOC100181668 n=1 Tax=Ciona intestinalis TaxID=7719 RepID=F6UES2_CIOIN|nr:uncharacterized protein LOC100181668 [Ciona intestinalis]|eukprot:XP_002128552.1 uncharacterized protein LOC100181668 [Ciona intestinalis]